MELPQDTALANSRIDKVIERVETILDMQPKNFNVDIYLHRGKLEPNRVAYYENRAKSIHISIENSSDGVLAHEADEGRGVRPAKPHDVDVSGVLHVGDGLAESFQGDVPEGLGKIPDVLLHDLGEDVAVCPDVFDGLFESGDCGQMALEVFPEHLLKFGITVEAQDLGKAHNGRFADPRFFGQFRGCQEDRLFIVVHDVLCYLLLSLSQLDGLFRENGLDLHERFPSINIICE